MAVTTEREGEMLREHVIEGHAGLARSPVMRRLYELAESRGVKVFWFPFERVDGIFTYSPRGRPIISLNPALRGRKRSFVFAHELGHAVLENAMNVLDSHKWSDEERERYVKMEQETDRFARLLLRVIRRGVEKAEGPRGRNRRPSRMEPKEMLARPFYHASPRFDERRRATRDLTKPYMQPPKRT